MRVKVYKNLQKNCWSVVGPDGKVIEHTDQIVLDDPEFRVQPAGNRKVRDEKRKNVHAYVVGEKVTRNTGMAPTVACPFTYNPYEHDSFVYAERLLDDDWKPLRRGDQALLLTDEYGDLTLVTNPS